MNDDMRAVVIEVPQDVYDGMRFCRIRYPGQIVAVSQFVASPGMQVRLASNKFPESCAAPPMGQPYKRAGWRIGMAGNEAALLLDFDGPKEAGGDAEDILEDKPQVVPAGALSPGDIRTCPKGGGDDASP